MPNYFDDHIDALRKQLRRAVISGDKAAVREICAELDMILALNNN